jgi:hypothetical protein
MNESQVVINVQQLSQAEKEQILYNHIKLGEQPRSFKTLIKPFLSEIAGSYRFLPEIARRLGDPLFTKRLRIQRQAILKFVEEPLEFLIEVVANLEAACRAGLALVFMRGGLLASPIELSENEEAALHLLGVGLPAAREALKALNGSLVSLVRSGDRATWMFKHPTIADAYASIVADDPELLDIYMFWTSTEKLITEVTCGDVGMEGVKVVVPESRFGRFTERLNEIESGGTLFTFLSTRCSASFLRIYLEHHPEIGDLISSPGSNLSAVPEVDLLVRLHEVNLLPDEWRLRFVDRARLLAIESPELDFLAVDRIRNLFRPEELDSIIALIRQELVPTLSGLVDDWHGNYERGHEPDEWFQPLREVIDILSSEFQADSEITASLSEVSDQIDWAIQDIQDNTPPVEFERYDDDYEGGRGPSHPSAGRSIFDDIDE